MRLFGSPDVSKLARKRDIKALVRALGSRDAAVRLASAEALAKLADPRSADALLAALRDAEPRVRMHASDAIDSIARHDATVLAKPAVVDLLIAALSDEAWNVRNKVVATLGRLGDRRAVDPLLGRLADPEAIVCHTAVRALGQLGDARAVRPILELFDRELQTAHRAEGMQDFRWVTTFAAAFDDLGPAGLPAEARAVAAVWCERWAEAAQLGGAAVDQLLLMLSQAIYRSGWGTEHATVFITGGERARAAGRGVGIDAAGAIRTLGVIGDPRSVQPICDYLRGGVTVSDDDAAAADALRQIPGLAAFEALTDGFLGMSIDFNGECGEYRSAIVSRARETGTAGDTDVLARLLFLLGYEAGYGNPHSEGAIATLGKDALIAYGPAAAGSVRTLLEHENPQVGRRAADVLAVLVPGSVS